jgi:hypothetical protein
MKPLLSLAPQPSLGLGLLHKIRLNFVEASQQFFYRVGLLAPRPTPISVDQASVFIPLRGRVAINFSRLLRHAWVTVGLFLFPGHHTGSTWNLVLAISITNDTSPKLVWFVFTLLLSSLCRNFFIRFWTSLSGSGAHPASYPMGNRASFTGGKATGTWSWQLNSI